MNRTLLLYDGKMGSSERIAARLSCLIGNAKVAELSDAPEDLSPYEGLCVVFTFYGAVTAAKAKQFLVKHREQLAYTRIAMIGIGFSDLGFSKFIADVELDTWISGITGIFLASETETNHIGHELGRMMRAAKNPLERGRLEASIESFISSHNTMALATGSEGFIRCTPVEYLYLGSVFYVISEGGSKFRGILDNGDVSAAIFDSYKDMKNLRGLQFSGKASVLTVRSEEYLAVMAAKNVTGRQLDELPVTMFVVRIDPLRYEFLNHEFEEEGFDAVGNSRL